MKPNRASKSDAITVETSMYKPVYQINSNGRKAAVPETCTKFGDHATIT